MVGYHTATHTAAHTGAGGKDGDVGENGAEFSHRDISIGVIGVLESATDSRPHSPDAASAATRAVSYDDDGHACVDVPNPGFRIRAPNGSAVIATCPLAAQAGGCEHAQHREVMATRCPVACHMCPNSLDANIDRHIPPAFLLGAMKCGTTGYANAMIQHPLIQFARQGKELHYFSGYRFDKFNGARGYWAMLPPLKAPKM